MRNNFKISVLFILALFATCVTAQWVFDFNNCPTTYKAQTCSGDDKVCGYDSPITYCADPGDINAPGSIATTYSTDNNASLDGGYSFNCTSYDGTAPHCDHDGSYVCERNESCHGSPMYRNTNCTASAFGQSSCGNCKTEGTDYFNCYGDINCESTSTSDCENSNNNHYITATCLDQSGGGTCECDTNYFACDNNISDADGCEWHAGDSCMSSTGTIQDDECFNTSQANCTRQSDYLDCNNDDSDSNQLTCNDGDGCEINPGTTNCAGGSHNNYVDCTTCQCDSGWLNCTDGVNATIGCSIDEGANCLNATSTGTGGTYQTDECYSNVGGNCTSSGTYLDCDDSDSDGNELTCNVGNGCEVLDGDSCSVGILSGTINGCSGGAANCEVDTQHHLTNQSGDGSSSHANLWTTQYGSSTTSWIFNGTQANFSTQIYFDHLANIITTGNATLNGGYICDLIACYNITGLNASGGTGDNTSWNQSYADTLYADISVVDTDTHVTADGNYLYNDSDTIYFNDTLLNATIDDRASADNSSWNESYGFTLFLNRTSEGLYTSTYNATYDSHTEDNTSWNESYADTLYAPLGSGNSSWNESHAYTLFLNKTSEGLYTTTYNATYDAKVSYNTTWNQSLGDSLYYNLTNPRGFYDSDDNITSLNASKIANFDIACPSNYFVQIINMSNETTTCVQESLSSNPFDQSLNTTDEVKFDDVNISDVLHIYKDTNGDVIFEFGS